MFCFNGASCHERYATKPYFMSSQPWASEMSQGGIFDSDPATSGFAGANLIYVKCAPPRVVMPHSF